MKQRSYNLKNLYPANWVVATLAIVVIFAAVYVLRPEPVLTPYEHMLQNVD